MILRLSFASWIVLLASLLQASPAEAGRISRTFNVVPGSEAGVHLPMPPGERAVDVRVVPLEISRKGAPETAPGVWPQASVVTGVMRGIEVVGVSVNSQLITATQELNLRSFRVDVTTAPAGAGALTYRRESPSGRRSFDMAWRTLTGAPAPRTPAREGPSLVNSGEPHHPTFRPSVTGAPVDMVIITDGAQETEYQRLADYKTQTGLLTVVRTVDWIEANYARGVDTQETVRNFIRDAATQWGTAWVILGGDTDVIPARYGFTTFFGSEEIPTDLYYSALDGTWDADGDGIFGEAPVDSCDLYPDVWVGRMPSRSAAEAGVLVDKTLAYQKTPAPGYHNDYLLFGEVLAPENWSQGETIFIDGAAYCDDLDAVRPPATDAVLMYENHTAWPGAGPLEKAVAVDSLNAGFHLVHHVGHGYINTMSLGLDNQTLINSDADALTNGNETFLLYAINCTSSAIDFNCLAERFMLNPAGGAVASVGSTRWDFPVTGANYQDAFYDYLFQQNVQEVGMLMALSKIPFIPNSTYDSEHRWTQFTQVYLGDPSLAFWLDEPAPLTVTHSGTYTLRDYEYSVNVNFMGSPAESALVTVTKEGDDHATGWTNALGNVSLNFNPDETGDFSVAAVYPNAVPYLDTATVSSAAAPYLFAASQTIVDDGSSGSSGNGDGRFDAGETVALDIVLENTGGSTEANVAIQLNSADPYLTITDSNSFYNDIPAGQTMVPADPVLITVDPSAPDKYEAKASLFVFGDSGPYVQEIIFYVHAPKYEYYRQAVRDTVGNGNGDGIITPGEDFVILPTVRNRGLGLGTGVGVRLRSSDGAVTIADSTAALGNLTLGDIVTPSGDGLQLSLADTTSYHELEIVIVDDRGDVVSRFIDWRAPAPVDGGTAVAFGSADAVALYWTPVSAPDLWGYNVYRSTAPGGPYARINQNTTEGIAYYADENLPPLSQFYYKMSAVDTSGNESPLSDPVSGTTTLPLKPGWPVEYSTATTGGASLADLDGDGQPEVLAAGEEVYALNADGTEFIDGDDDVRTLGPFSSTNDALFWNTPAAADIDLDGTMDVAAVSWDAELWVWDADGNVRSGFPKDVNPFNEPNPAPLGSVSFGDCDADGDLEILCTVGDVIFIWKPDGTELADGDSDGGTDGVFAVTGTLFSYGTPTVANIDDEPFKEIIAGMRDGKLYVYRADGTAYPGFPFATGDEITSPPVVGDIDGDDRVEIIFGSANENLYALRADLTQPGSWPVSIQLMQDQAPAASLGDLTGDGNPDVVIGGSNGTLWAFDGPTGNVLSNFPIPVLDGLGNQVEIRSSAALADLDNDGDLDMVVGDQLGRLLAYDAGGAALPGFPIRTGNLIQGSPAVGDIDGDGLNEVAVQSFDQRIYCWDTPWTTDSAKIVWPMFKGNPQNSGVSGEGAPSVTSVGDDEPAPLLLRSFPNPARSAVSIRYTVPASEGASGVPVRLSVYTIDGRLVRELVKGRQPPGVYEADWDLTDGGRKKMAAGIYPYRLQVGDRTVNRKLVVLP